MKNQNLPHIQRVKFKKIEKKFSILDTFKNTLAKSIFFFSLARICSLYHAHKHSIELVGLTVPARYFFF
jgi:hypothetical protein